VPAKLVRIIHMAMEQSEKFSLFKGVRQGATLSTIPRYITLDHIIKKLTTVGTVTSRMTE
jgi:hypothetical protein